MGYTQVKGVYNCVCINDDQHVLQIEKLACTTMNSSDQIPFLSEHVIILEMYLIFNL